ncbi:unnamed protein product [Bursaphelenchus okinawaensis]|uniref:Uncharacterized protein n=1 Tax=Bursaphelenchus okinawaensis TaxID=465554 RepID=A0A811KLM0_9BILA|nr:unnamed protein product [Bursaphelenchus okinawaensis]CAG9106273.1 unnamed protein product [Bursaphelenchus okinawaensis]
MPFDAQVYYETPIGEVFPLERIIEFQMTIPVTRALIDVPLTSTFYTVDLDYVRENERIAFKQQLVPFNAPLLQQYAPIVVAGPEFFTCGGADPLTNVVTAERVIISNKTYTGY